MLFRFSQSEKYITIVALIISLLFHTAIFAFFSGSFHIGEKSKDPIEIDLIVAQKEEPPPPEEKAEEEIKEKQLEKCNPLPEPPPPPKQEIKKATRTEKKGNTPSVSPLIAKKYKTRDIESVSVPEVPEEKKVTAVPPAVISEPIHGTPFGTGTGAEEDKIKEMDLGSTFGPSFKNMVKPEYPEFARRMGKESYVLLRVMIDEYGNVKKVDVIQSGGKIFDEEAIKAIKRSTFNPAKENGRPVPCYVKIPIRFQLVQK